MNEKILILEKTSATNKVKKVLASKYDIILYEEYLSFNVTRQRQTANYIKGIICRLKFNIDKEFLNQFLKLKFIATVTTGITHIDLEYLNENNIKILTLKDTNGILDKISGTSDLAITLALTLYHKILYAYEMTKSGKWDRDFFYRNQLSNQEVGIIGFGRLGRNIAKVLLSLGMNVFYNDNIQIESSKNFKFKTIKKILNTAKIIFISASYQPYQEFILKTKDLKNVKNYPIIINISRAQLIDPNFIFKGLQNRILSGYGGDVLFNEHSPKNELKELYSYENVLITPHIGGTTIESIEITELALSNLIMEM